MKEAEGTMITKELAVYDGLPEDAKSACLALAVLIDRIGSLPKPDRECLFELLQAWPNADGEERHDIRRAMEEILAQVPIKSRRMDMAAKELSRSSKNWADHVGKVIRQMREKAGLTQIQLATKAGLLQSHISRLENAEYSATNMTLEKIAKALGITVRDIDPTED